MQGAMATIARRLAGRCCITIPVQIGLGVHRVHLHVVHVVMGHLRRGALALTRDGI